MPKRKGTRRKTPVSSPTAPTTRAAVLERAQRHPWLAVALLAGILLPAVYSVALLSPTLIVHEDSVLQLPVLSHLRNVPHIFSRDFLLFSSGQFRPFSYAVLAAVRTFVAPERILFWHIWLLAFHIANTLLVFAIVRHFSPRVIVALTAAGVFGLHPLCTVIVNDVNQFYMLLGLTLSLGSLTAYLSFSRNGSKTLYSVAVGLFLLGAATARPAVWLGLVLLAYELLYRRSGLERTLLRLCPFALIALSLFRLSLWYSPHPLHYKSVPVTEGLFWHGLFSVTGATGQYGSGLLLTRGIPSVLHEIVEKIHHWNNVRFLVWAAIDLALIVGAVVAVARKQWAALGVLLLFIVMIPYASVAYNRVVDYVSWSYLYFPVAGLALFAGGLYEHLLQIRRRSVKVGVNVAFLAALLFLGARTVQLNVHTRSPLSYWSHVFRLNPRSQTCAYETGKACLAKGQVSDALHYFFAPIVEELKRPCLAMARHYLRKGDLLASAVHLRSGSVETTAGIILEEHCHVAGELLLEAGALDHAEENFGKVLMVNPFNTAAMIRLAQVWFIKGFTGEAYRMLERARALSPHDKDIARAEKEFRKYEPAWENSPPQLTIVPPDPQWLRYVLTQMRHPSVRREIVALSNAADPNDAVIHLEAVICLLIDGRYEAAAKEVLPSAGETRAGMVLHGLSGNSYACAVVSRAYALAGKVDEAVRVAVHAVSLDSQNTLAWECLALAVALRDKPDVASKELVKAVVQNPASASTFYYNLGLQKKEAGKNSEAADLFEKALKAQPDNVEALQALGEVFLKLGQPERAAEALRKALKINPGDARTHANLGWALLDVGENAAAVTALRNAIEIDPKSPLYHSDLGAALSRLSKLEESEREYRRAIELDPGFVNAHYNLANLLARVGNLSGAAAEYSEVIQIMPAHPNVHFDLSRVLYRQGKLDEAIRELQEEVRHDPRAARAYSALVILYCEKGEYSVAAEVVKRADSLGLEIAPDALATLRRVSPGGDE